MRCAPFKTAPDEILFSAELFTRHARSKTEQAAGKDNTEPHCVWETSLWRPAQVRSGCFRSTVTRESDFWRCFMVFSHALTAELRAVASSALMHRRLREPDLYTGAAGAVCVDSSRCSWKVCFNQLRLVTWCNSLTAFDLQHRRLRAACCVEPPGWRSSVSIYFSKLE